MAADADVLAAITPPGADPNAYRETLQALVDTRPARFKSTRVPALAMREIMKSPGIAVVGAPTDVRDVKVPQPIMLINPSPPRGELGVRIKTAAARGDYISVVRFLFRCARPASCSRVVGKALCAPARLAAKQNNVLALEQALADYHAPAGGAVKYLCAESYFAPHAAKPRRKSKQTLGALVEQSERVTPREAEVLSALGAHRHTFGELIRLGGVKLVMCSDDELEAFMRARASELKRRAETLRHSTELDAQFAASRQYLQIVDDMLGRVRGHALRRALQRFAVATPQQLLAELNDRERGIVKSERRNREEHMRALVNNRCPHLRAVRDLRRKPTLRRLNYALEFRAEKSGDEWLRCKNCSFPLICPHVAELLRLRLDPGGRPPDISAAMRKFQSRIKRPDTMLVFCRVCNEQLRDSANDGLRGVPIKLQQSILQDDERVGEAWSDAMRVIDGRRRPLLDFDRPIGSSALAGDVSRQALHLAELMFQQREFRRRQGTPGFRRLITVVFIYASLYNAVMSKQVHVMGHRKSAPDVIAKAMLSHLVSTFGQLVSSVTDVTREQIAKQFVDAYQVVLASVGRQTVNPTDAMWEMCNEVAVLNPFYYAAQTARHAEMTTASRPKNPAKAAAEKFAKIVGRTAPDILKSTPPPGLADFSRAVLNGGSIEYPAASVETTEPLWSYRIPALQVYRKTAGRAEAMRRMRDLAAKVITVTAEVAAHDGPLWIGGRASAKTKKQTTAKPGADGAFKLLQEYSSVHNERMWCAYLGVLTEARRVEAAAKRESSMMGLPFVNMHVGVRNEHTPPARIAELSEVYDEEGRKHRWTIALWGKKEFTARELYREIPRAKESPLKGLKFEGVKCSVCGVLRTQTAQLSANKIRRALKSRVEAGALFGFFAVRCPEGGAHDWRDGGCAKCGLHQSVLNREDFQTKGARAYFEKYSPLLKKDFVMRGNKGLRGVAMPKARRTKSAPAADDSRFLLEAAAILQVAPETLKSIGSCENVPVDASCDGKCSVDTTARNVQGRVQQFTFDYSRAYHEDSEGLAPPKDMRAAPTPAGLCRMFVEVFR
ncbi:MAG: hypothetical protein P1U53_14110, partial [Sulfitobacter sp.]|nr:hypothetical protein [Sulfitobacter sp.]